MDITERNRRDRISKLFYLREEPFVICARRLLRLGYRDVEIDIPICEKGIESDEYCAELRKMTIIFRHQGYRYRMDVQCYDGYTAPNDIYRVFSKVIGYITDPEAMCKTNIGKDFPTYLEEHKFTDISQEGEVGIDAANLTAFRGDTKYRILFHRNYEQEIQTSLCEFCGHANVDPAARTSYLDLFQKWMIAHEKFYQVQGNHRIKLAEDLSQLDIALFQGWRRSNISIRPGPLSMQIANDFFCHVVHCWMRSKGCDDLFPDNIIGYGHVPQNFTDNHSSFEILYHGVKYSIITRTGELVDFDNMDGHSFERFCAAILAYNGFIKVQVTQGSRDQGVDIIAQKDDIRYGIQCKCYSTDIGNKAIQEVYAGKAYYNCDVAVVLTNRYFTKPAIELAQKNRVHLWDRHKLCELIENCKEQLLGY